MKNKKLQRGLTLLEVLIGMTISVILFLFATNIMVVLFNSTNKDKRIQDIEQVKNDIQIDLSNKVKWAESVSFSSGMLTIDGDSYRVQDEGLYKNDVPLTPKSVKIKDMKVEKQTVSYAIKTPKNGTGLLTEFYNDPDLSVRVSDGISKTVDFDWGADAPSGLNTDNFSIRFLGQIEVSTDGTYTFYVTSNDGARLTVHDEELIDAWNSNGVTDRNGSINLEGGRKYALILEYRDKVDEAAVRLSWSGPGFSEEVIPTEILYPTSLVDSINVTFEMEHAETAFIKDTLQLILSVHSGGLITITD